MDFKDALLNIKETMIEKEEVFDAVRRGYTDLQDASESEILEYFSFSSINELKGHVNNIKGILFEQEVQDKLSIAGIDSNVFEETNHPVTDLQIIDDGEIFQELQLKATNSSSYINETLLDNPDTMIIATSEIASRIDNNMVINSEISNSILEETVLETISPMPVSTEGLLIRGALFLFTGIIC